MANYKPINISTIINPDNLNLAEYFDDDELAVIGNKLKRAYEIDLQSRHEWDTNMKDWMKLAVQYKEEKSFPWPKAANVKYPLITTAAMQFAARAYPNLIVGKKPVKGRIVGQETPELQQAVERISQHMSYQLMEENKTWEEEMDRLFVVLPILGVAYKKVFHDSITGMNQSRLVLPSELIINYWASDFDKVRKHQICELTENDIYTHVQMGEYLDVELPRPSAMAWVEDKKETSQTMFPSEDDDSIPYKILECHCNWDLDQDGYREPYIITIEYQSAQVLRIVPRFREDSITFSSGKKKPEVVRVEPDQYFTKYGFIPNPDGSFYDLGFGLLLGPLNESVNSAINQTLDQGTMYNTGGGFLGKGIRIKAGEYKLAPNEWKVVNTTTDDLRKAIFPNPVKTPSNIPMELAKMLIEGGNKVASIADIFTGKMPGQNTPATTTMETVKQSSAVFTAIYKRIYRSFDDELKKLFNLNKLYLDDQIDYPVELTRSDYEQAKLTVIPTADPDTATDSEKLTKAQALMQLLQTGVLNPQVVVRRVLEAMRIENIEELMNYQPQPSPEQQKAQAELEKIQRDAEAKERQGNQKMQIEQQKAMQAQRNADLEYAQAERMAKLDQAGKMADIRAKMAGKAMELQGKQQEVAVKSRMTQIQGADKIQSDRRMMAHKEQMAKQQAKMKPKSSDKGKK